MAAERPEAVGGDEAHGARRAPRQPVEPEELTLRRVGEHHQRRAVQELFGDGPQHRSYIYVFYTLHSTVIYSIVTYVVVIV